MGTNSLNSLDNLYGLLNSSKDDVFDVRSIIENQKTYEQLIRLLRTYKEYLNKESSLKYFGFVGHFSSGKSSTINSILKSETEDERKEGLHPIDTGITVISHSDNRNRFIVTQNNGGLAAGYQLVDNDILKNSVFVDTPGSGDEKTLSELVTDYLPICDKIVFIISATQPLTESEIPIFKEVCENLKFLPICLVVTRADEFRKDKLKIFNKENFSLEEYRSFETELISRLTQVTKDNRFNNSTIIPINNIDGFGIEALREHIRETIEEKDFNISSIKDDFFRLKGKKIILHFKSYIEKKDNELIHLKNTSDRNHKEFSSKAELHNNKLTENWRERKDALNGVLKSVHSFHLSISDDIQTAENFSTGIHKEELLSKINENFKIHSINVLNHLLDKELNRITKEIKEAIYKSDDDKISNNHKFSEILEDSKEKFLSTYYEVYRNVYMEHKLFLLEILSKEHDNLTNINSANIVIQRSINKNRYLNKSEEIYSTSLVEFDEMMDSYLVLVKLYKAGITSRDSRQIIKNLGLDRLIDDADRITFSEEEIDNWKNKLKKDIFPGEYNFSFNKTFNLESSEKIEKIIEKNELYDINLDNLRKQIENMTPSATIDETIATEFNQQFIALSTRKIKKLIDDIDSTSRSRKEESRRINMQIFFNSFFHAFGVSLVVFFVLFSSYIGWIYLSEPLPNSISASLGVGVSGSLIASIIVGIIKFIFDKKGNSYRYIPNSKYANTSKIVDDHISEFTTSLDNLNKKFSTQSVDYFLLISKTSVMESKIGNKVNSLCNNINNLNQELEQLISLHEKNISLPINQVINSLDNVDENLTLLQNISKSIQEKAINPVLEQFKEYSKKLSLARDKIDTIYAQY